jgi:hypothetical protein
MKIPPIPAKLGIEDLITAINDRLRRVGSAAASVATTTSTTSTSTGSKGTTGSTGASGSAPPPQPKEILGNFSFSQTPQYAYSDVTANSITLYIYVTPPQPVGTVVGAHIYIEFPDQSSGQQAVAGISRAGVATATGVWNPYDAGKFPYVSTQQPWQVPFNFLPGPKVGTMRIYVQSYSADLDPAPIQAGKTGATPNTTITISPFVAPKTNSGVNVTPFLVTSVTPLTDSNYANGVTGNVPVSGVLHTPIAVQVSLSGLPNPLPDNWYYQLMGYINGDTTTPPVLSSGLFNIPIPRPGTNPPDYGAGQGDGITLYHTFGQTTPVSQISVTIYAISGLIITPTRNVGGVLKPVGGGSWSPNNIVPGITPSCTVTYGGPGGVLDLSAGTFSSQGLGVQVVNGQLQIASDNTQNMLFDGNFSLAPQGFLSGSSLSQWKPWNYFQPNAFGVGTGSGTVQIIANDGTLTNPQFCRISGQQEGIYQSAAPPVPQQKTFVVTPGDFYYGSIYYRSNNVTPGAGQTHNFFYGMGFNDVNGVFIGFQVFAQASGFVSGWTFADGQIQIPGGAATASIGIQVGNEPNGGYWDFQTVFLDRIYPAVQIQQGNGIVAAGSGPQRPLAVKGFDGFNQLNVGANGASMATKIIVNDHTGTPIGWIGDDTAVSGDAGGWFKSLWVGGTSPANAAMSVDSTGKMAINMTSSNAVTTPIQINLASCTFTVDSAPGYLDLQLISANGSASLLANTTAASLGLTFGGHLSSFIQTTNGGAISVVDGSGNTVCLIDKNWACRVLAYNSANQTLTNGGFNLLQFDTHLYAVGTAIHSTVTNNTRFTAPVAGFYLAFAQVGILAGVTGLIQLNVYKNGSVTSTPAFVSNTKQDGTLSFRLQILAPLQLAANDYIEFGATDNTGSSETAIAGAGWGALALISQP